MFKFKTNMVAWDAWKSVKNIKKREENEKCEGNEKCEENEKVWTN